MPAECRLFYWRESVIKALKQLSNSAYFSREKFYALRAFIYKARRASKKVAGKYVLKKTFFSTI